MAGIVSLLIGVGLVSMAAACGIFGLGNNRLQSILVRIPSFAVINTINGLCFITAATAYIQGNSELFLAAVGFGLLLLSYQVTIINGQHAKSWQLAAVVLLSVVGSLSVTSAMILP